MVYLSRWLLRHSDYSLDKDGMTLRISIVTASIAFFFYHTFYFVYYLLLGWHMLLPLNLEGMALYAAVIILNRQKASTLSCILFVSQLALSCVVQVYYIGWESCAQWYLPVIMIPIYMMRQASVKIRQCAMAAFCASMLACYLEKLYIVPYYAGRDITGVVVTHIIIFMLGGVMGIEVLNFSSTFMEKYYKTEIETLTNEAYKDVLTQMWNRRHMEQVLTKTFADAEKRDGAYLAMVDIDHFKKVNDTYGHDAGDVVLNTLARTIFTSFRNTDISARWGGEEFVILLSPTSAQGAKKALEGFRKRVEKLDIKVNDYHISITVTVGYSGCASSGTFPECIKKIDSALYYGKNNGRNRVVKFDEVATPSEQSAI